MSDREKEWKDKWDLKPGRAYQKPELCQTLEEFLTSNPTPEQIRGYFAAAAYNEMEIIFKENNYSRSLTPDKFCDQFFAKVKKLREETGQGNLYGGDDQRRLFPEGPK